MSDKEARVLAAGDSIEVNGKEFQLKPIGMQQLHEVQRAAVDHYKREYLRTYAQNLDLLPKDQAAKLIEKKLEEVARWDIGNLPVKMAHDVKNVPVDSEWIVAFLEGEFGDLPEAESARKSLLATALDSGKITVDDVEKKTKARPRRVRVPYDSWWVTASYDGMVTFIWASLQTANSQVTKQDVGGWPLGKVVEASRIVERLTAPALGNM